MPRGRALPNTISRSLDEASTPDFLTAGGEMGALMRPHDWSSSSLGDPRLGLDPKPRPSPARGSCAHAD